MEQFIRDELPIHDLNIRKANLVLRALNHPIRLKILRFIDQQLETVVSNIYNSLHLRQSVASLHLAVLKKAGFVIARREGKNIWYRVNVGRIHTVQRLIHKFLERLPFH